MKQLDGEKSLPNFRSSEMETMILKSVELDMSTLSSQTDLGTQQSRDSAN